MVAASIQTNTTTVVTDPSIATITVTSHGLVAGDIGKPIGWRGTASGKPFVWTDTSETEEPVAILESVVDTNTITIAYTGAVIDILDSLLPASMPVNGGNNNNRSLYWDKSAGKYVHVAPPDSVIKVPVIYWIGTGDAASTGKVLVKLPDQTAPNTEFVTTVADLAALTPIDGTIAMTAGYNAANDGGNRMVYYSQAAGDTVDGVMVFNGPGSVGRWLAMDLNTEVTPRQAGCIGDGTTDDYTRLTYMVAAGKDILITDGTFATTGTLILSTAGQTLRCSSTGALKQKTDNVDLISVTANKVTIDGLNATGFGTAGDPNTYTNNKAIKAVSVWGLRVRNCRIDNFSFAGIYLQGCKRFSIIGNEIWGNITTSHDSSADIVTWGTCTGGIIMGNTACSDSDVGIMVGALQGDGDITICNNIVATMNSSGVITPPVQRRRGISVHYSTDADELNYITVANNVVSGSQNAGIYYNGWGGAIIIHGNTVRNTSILTGGGDESLSGCIAILGSARSIIVSNNDCSNNVSDSVGCISIYRSTAGATANLGSTIVVGNICHDSASYGISVLGTSARLRIENNNITNCTYHGIYVASYTALDAEGLEINHNTIQWATATACGIYIDTQGSTNMVKCHHNTIIYTGTKGATNVNSGIYSQRYNLHAHHNTIKGCDGGIYFYTNLTGRTLVPDIEFNLMEDLDVAFICRGNDAHATMPIGLTNKIDNCGVSQGGDGSYEAARFCSVDRINGLITLRQAAVPANGTWVIGDKYERTAPAAAGYIGGVCTAGGTPGTWKDYGAIVA